MKIIGLKSQGKLFRYIIDRARRAPQTKIATNKGSRLRQENNKFTFILMIYHRGAKSTFLIFLLFISGFNLFSQEDEPGMVAQPSDSSYSIIETIDGNEFTGIILNETTDTIKFKTDILGIIRIPKSKIREIERITPEKIIDGRYYYENPHATRYFYGPNGYGIKKGEGYYQNTWVLFNQVSYGATDYFSIGTGVVPLVLFEGAPTPVWITPKFSIPLKKDKLNLGAGALMAIVLGEEDASLGIAYGTFTYGSRDKNLTLGTGWASGNEGFGERPTFSLSGMYRIGQKGYLITENYLISTPNESVGILSLGGRTVQKRLAVDYGLIIPVESGISVAIPWLSITMPFAAKRN